MRTFSGIRHDQRGAVLLVTLMVLLILTTLGIAVISTTTTEIMITGNAKLQKMAFYGGDGGGRSVEPILEESLNERAVPAIHASPSGPVVDPAGLMDELLGIIDSSDDPMLDPDLISTLGDVVVRVDVDRIARRFQGGSSIEFGSGYEGIGKSSASGGTAIMYQIDASGEFGRSQGQVGNVYIYRPR